MSIKPFQWTNLKKVSGAEVQLVESLFSLLPKTSAADKLVSNVRTMLMKHLGERSFYYLDSVSTDSYDNFIVSLPESAVLAIVGIEPSGSKMVLHIDNSIAFLLIDKLLGGGGEPSLESRALSETEQGVLQYFIMQILAQVWQTFGEAAKLHFRFERFAFSPQDVLKTGGAKGAAISLAFKVGIGELSGFVKMIFTSDLIRKTSALTSKIASPPEIEHFVNELGRYDYIMTSLWADGGKVTVSSNDIVSLETGDVLIFDETGISLKDGKPSGSVELKTGRGEEGSLRADITTGPKVLKCRVVNG